VSLAVAVATCVPRPPDVLSAEGVVDVGAAAAAPCVKSLRSSSSNSYVVSHPAERALWRACKPCWNVGERPSRTSSSSYVVANTVRIVSSKLSSMQLPTESAGATAEPVLLSNGKRHCGVGGWSGGRPPGHPEHLASWSWRIQIRAITSPSLTSPTTSFLPDLAHERATGPLFKASAFAFRSFPLLICLPSAFAPLGNKRHHHHLVGWAQTEFIRTIGLILNEVISEKPAKRAHATHVAWTGGEPSPDQSWVYRS